MKKSYRLFYFVILFFIIRIRNIDSYLRPDKELYSYVDNSKSTDAYHSLQLRSKSKLNENLEPFVFLQLELEKIASESDLYDFPNSEESGVPKNLLNDSFVEKVVSECSSFHNTIKCDERYPYRTFNGSCNNLKNPKWGSTFSTNVRMMPAVYNGAYGLRKSVTGKDLPGVRNITLNLFPDQHNPSQEVSSLFVLFGQIIDHDITSTPIIYINGTRPICCGKPQSTNQVCAPITISPTDPFYADKNKTCLEFVRSAPFPTCDFDKRVSMNSVTSFIDASFVYGEEKNKADGLRAFDGLGKLRDQDSPYGKLLPPNNDFDDLCPPNVTELCFKAGHGGLNEHVYLQSLQTLFLREHNRLADNLHQLNPQWDEETLFQEARKILVAELQSIVCNDFLPPLVGPDGMRAHNLCQEEYDDSKDSSVIVEFSTAAYRLHSMISRQVDRKHPDLSFMNISSDPMPMYSNYIGTFFTEASYIPAESNDHCMIPDMMYYLYKYPYENYGTDLPSIHIQRGRDHGLPSYVNLAEKCSLKNVKISRFSDLRPLMKEENILLLEGLYEDVRDVDLWIGLLMENVVPGGVTGPTSRCVIAKQFQHLLSGDRFFYKNKNQLHSFTDEQIEELNTSTLARLLCENTVMSETPINPMLMPSTKNPTKSCKDFPTLNMNLWKFNDKNV